MAPQEDPDLLRILIATDNHLGVHEKDHVRKDDAFITFREIFEIAKQQYASERRCSGTSRWEATDAWPVRRVITRLEPTRGSLIVLRPGMMASKSHRVTAQPLLSRISPTFLTMWWGAGALRSRSSTMF